VKAYWLDGEARLTEQALGVEGVHNATLGTGPEFRASLEALKGERGYVEEDVVTLSPATPNLDTLCAQFVDEHHHDDDEVRFVLEGEGVFDIRSRDDRWMRVRVEAGDLIVVPAARHHRFMLTEQKTIRCIRLFKDRAGWVPHYRA
jgi:1,2-dihydroxy-3-keto-5-methylthiopentene dioxygenase